jgi:putative glycosyltransferase (TIGR04372 family)
MSADSSATSEAAEPPAPPERSELLYPLHGSAHHPYTWHFHQGMYAYRDANVDLALHHFDQCRLQIPTDWFVVYVMSHIQLQLVGDVHEAIRLLKYARRMRERVATPKEGKPPYIFLDSMWAHQIGHIANMEHLIKREILRGNDTKRIVLLRPEKPANQVLLDKFAAYITIANSEPELPFPESTMRSVLEEYFICESIDGVRKHWWHASPEIFDAWERDGRAPLLSLTDAELKKGRAILSQAGIPKDAWFACVHIREASFKKDLGLAVQEAGLNADCATYLPAIKKIIDRGGWVVRIGDSGMSPLPASEGLFDYAHSPFKSPWMDIFLLGECRFFVGTSSGPAYVPPLFGIPCALTNWYPTGSRPFNGRDIFIPKLIQAGTPARTFRFEDMFTPPFGYTLHYKDSGTINLSAISNTADEIHDVVVELLDRLENKSQYSGEDRSLQQAFEAVAETNFCFGNARMGRDFLRRHKELLL